MRVRARKDANHTQIVKEFRDAGASVLDTAQLGKGAPDILIGYQGHNVAIEIKDGSKPPSKRLLTTDEAQFHDDWQGWIEIVYTIDDVTRIIGEISEKG